MNVPVTIEGAKYFVTLPGLKDLQTFQTFLQREYRRAAFAAIPDDLSGEALKKWMRAIDEECDRITPANPKDFGKLANNAEGATLLFHAMLRHEQPQITLDWVAQLLARAQQEKPAALEAMRELRKAMDELIELKKKEQAERNRQADPQKEPATGQGATSTESTST